MDINNSITSDFNSPFQQIDSIIYNDFVFIVEVNIPLGKKNL